jgi:hypothetical protein
MKPVRHRGPDRKERFMKYWCNVVVAFLLAAASLAATAQDKVV